MMAIVKYLFLFIIFLGVSWIGSLISRKYKKRVEELYTFKESCNILLSKIKFTYEPLGDIFKDISKIIRKNNHIYEIFENSSSNMKSYDLKESLERAISNTKQNLNLKDEDLNVIKRLGNMLGKTDITGQLSEIELTMDFTDTQIRIAEEECLKNEKMYRNIGTIFGLAIVIILI